MEHTLEEFLQRHQAKAVDFGLRAECYKGQWRFYIHPQHVDGETWDFEVNGNQLTCVSVPSTLDS
ncbi:hypothetical protein [Nostoc sp. PCC 7107]|uniref:hypothetical protein n=1 Tax=Nostoc sp. PCC 7107 TaxID=317936 RepID=UPI00029F07A2|nr:hypothetical protein [Nostoc sp. PCC 7107]AFY43672.1 hypothetical protein Nos7107_3081 [Nostoc sp. PCC 7107]